MYMVDGYGENNPIVVKSQFIMSLVERIDPRTGAISLKIGKAEAVLPKNEQIGGENVKEGDYIKVYVVDVRETEKGPKAIISRTPPRSAREIMDDQFILEREPDEEEPDADAPEEVEAQ